MTFSQNELRRESDPIVHYRGHRAGGSTGPRVAVIGGGIAGLTAAYRLRTLLGPTARISVLEVHGRLGGMLKTLDLPEGTIESGAEAYITRRPEVADLVAELGLEDQLVSPSGLPSLLRIGGRLRPLPSGTMMGVPADADSVAGLVDDDTLRRIAAEPETPLRWDRDRDVSVGALVAERYGRQVVDNIVDPLLGGVYSGIADALSVRAAIPPLAAALDAGATSLSAAVTAARPTPGVGPLFATFRNGYRTLLEHLATASEATILMRVAGESIARTSSGTFYVDPVGEVEGVVVAVQAPQASLLLRPLAPEAAAAAAEIELAGSVVVGMVYDDLLDDDLPQNSGVLVATGESISAKAFTLWSRKWPHVAARGHAVIRASFGRHGDQAPLSYADDDLIRTARADLADTLGVERPPRRVFVQRWSGGLPQHTPGHLDRVARIEHGVGLVRGLGVAGTLLRSVGVPGVVGSADAAARKVAADLGA